MSFKKIVSDLSFSPSTIGRLNSLAKQNKNEEITRKIGLLFLTLTVALNFITVLNPIDSSNSASQEDMISRGYGIDTGNCNISNEPYCNKEIMLSEVAVNLSQGNIPAQSSIAEPGDQINLTLTIKNPSEKPTSINPSVRLADTLEYSTLIDLSGGQFDKTTNILSWNTIVLNPSDTLTNTYSIRIMDTIPSTAHGKIYSNSYDCKLTNTFGNTTNIDIRCPIQKNIELFATALPSTYSLNGLAMMSIILAISAFIYIRIRQMRREIKLLRKDISAGSI